MTYGVKGDFLTVCNFPKIWRIEDLEFSKRRSTFRFANEKVEWRKVENKVHIVVRTRITAIFETFVGSNL